MSETGLLLVSQALRLRHTLAAQPTTDRLRNADCRANGIIQILHLAFVRCIEYGTQMASMQV